MQQCFILKILLAYICNKRNESEDKHYFNILSLWVITGFVN